MMTEDGWHQCVEQSTWWSWVTEQGVKRKEPRGKDSSSDFKSEIKIGIQDDQHHQHQEHHNHYRHQETKRRGVWWTNRIIADVHTWVTMTGSSHGGFSLFTPFLRIICWCFSLYTRLYKSSDVLRGFQVSDPPHMSWWCFTHRQFIIVLWLVCWWWEVRRKEEKQRVVVVVCCLE